MITLVCYLRWWISFYCSSLKNEAISFAGKTGFVTSLFKNIASELQGEHEKKSQMVDSMESSERGLN